MTTSVPSFLLGSPTIDHHGGMTVRVGLDKIFPFHPGLEVGEEETLSMKSQAKPLIGE